MTVLASSEIDRLGPWFHNVHLPDGRQTRPDHFLGDFPRFKWEALGPHLPRDLSGWTALDIGCNAGFYTIELAKRGAEVLAVDHDRRYLRQAEWTVAQWDLADRVEFRAMDVYELATLDRRFDLVLFMGVFYHLRYPLLGLDIVSNLVGRLLVFQTLHMPGDEVAHPPENPSINDRGHMLAPGYPKMAFIEHRLADDPTNWWAANRAAVEAMLRSSGLEVTGRPMDETYLCVPRSPGAAGGAPVVADAAIRTLARQAAGSGG